MLVPDALVLDGRFRVLGPLGSGGMGEVYLGEQVSLGRKVAIKVLHHDLHTQPGMAERFKREARLLSAVEHPSVVRIVDFGESGDAACLVMEFVEGQSLYDALQQGPLPAPRALALLHQLAEGLAAIHEKGIIHRDLKPENVFISPSVRGEQARLLDFGIARLVEPDANSALSQIGVVLGTPEYLSPEQAMGAKVDTRSDLYSFGVLAYRVLSGRLPFDGPSPRHFLSQHASHAPLPLERAAPQLSRYVGLLSLVMRLLDKDPAKRLQTANELADALGIAHAALVAFTPSQGTPIVHAGMTPSGGMAAYGPPGVLRGEPSGTSAFGVTPAQPGPGSGTAAFGVTEAAGAPSVTAPPVQQQRTGTAVFGTAPRVTGSMGAVTGGAAVAKPQNVTVMLTDIQGFTERMSRQTHEENARMLDTHDRLLLPLVREHDGKLVQKRGDALLAVFRAPSSSVRCGMAMQQALWKHNQTVSPEQQLHVRVCLHAGEVLVTSDSVLGEPMEVVKAVEHVAAAGEVTFTEAVNMVRNRAEASAEPCGTIPLPGREEQVQLYRVVRAAEGPPFGEALGLRDSAPKRSPLEALNSLRPKVRAGLEALNGLSQKAGVGVAMLRQRPRVLGGAVAALVLLTAGVAWWVHASDPLVKARALLEEGRPAEALQQLNGPPMRKGAPATRLRAAVKHAQGSHDEEHVLLLNLDKEGRAGLDTRLLDGLAEDFGNSEQDRSVRRVLETLPPATVRSHFEALTRGEPSVKQWGALRYLESVQATEGLDLVGLYTTALDSPDCGVRTKAATRLSALGNPSALPALTRVAEAAREKPPAGTRPCNPQTFTRALEELKKKTQAAP
ncbi:protein kinase domain-containing protein [Corallococcus llansteffanensis]|uniref:Protein kinase n=1 Tax=Corallococcus llansteffanensis TaxID=2316731 RepID=A0A3A8Q3S9_9BACT|nr:protein kinase [Corallococcus llansteffanensis]RKH63323.1 protein kinase [Corallococcus llansteffanensis]